MERDHARVNVVAGTVALVAVGILLAALYYAIVTRADPVRCIFGDAQCSQTAATYLLALLTAGAFYATYRAVLYTKKYVNITSLTLQQYEKATEYTRRSYENSLADRTPAMTLKRCTNIDDNTLFAHPGHMQDRDRTHGHLGADVREYFLDDLAMAELATAPPAGCVVPPNCITPSQRRAAYPYEPYSFDVLSLGRVPFINGYLYLTIAGRSDPLRLYVGSVAPNDFVHIVLWIRKELEGRGKIRWSKTATDDSPIAIKYWAPPEELLGPTLDFAAEAIVPTIDYELPNYAPGNGPENADGEAPPP